MRDNLDRFYTPHSTAQQCVDVIDNLNDYDHILEPSAGSGSFSTLLDNCFAYDIAPQHKDIITQDFLQLQNLPQHKSSLVIGNPPPFGIRSQLAKKFISHSIDLGADTIAFVLPRTFVKYTNQTMFSNEWRLVDVVLTEDNNFLLDNSTIFIPCYFFVWTRLKDYKPSIDLRDKKYLPAKEFSFCVVVIMMLIFLSMEMMEK